MLKYTGHPLVDVGVAAITAFVDKRDPGLITEADLQKVVDFITREYTRQPLVSFLTVAFPNSGFTNPAYGNQPEKRRTYAGRVLQAYRADTPILEGTLDVFSGQPVADVPFDVKGELRPGYAFRQHIPLLTGEGVINFYPGGEAGLPVSGTTMLALQAFPLGCAKCSGRLLAVHSDSSDLICHFAATFLRRNREAIHLVQSAGGKKMPEAQFSHRTLLIDTLLQAHEKQREAHEDRHPASLTAYHLSNSGQGPGLDIYYLPLEMISFLRKMQTAEYHQEWNQIVARAWEVAPVRKGGKKDDKSFQPRRNWLYEDLFGLPGNAARFIRTYFLRIALRYAKGKTDPRGSYSLRDEAGLVSWKVAEQFLRRIVHMDKERVEEIRKMGDQLADYVSGQNDRRFFRDFFTIQRYDYFRTALIKANLAHVRRGNPPIVRLDPYIRVFEEGDEMPQTEWRLARDLVLIRMVEHLWEQGWLTSNVDALPEPSEETESV